MPIGSSSIDNDNLPTRPASPLRRTSVGTCISAPSVSQTTWRRDIGRRTLNLLIRLLAVMIGFAPITCELGWWSYNMTNIWDHRYRMQLPAQLDEHLYSGPLVAGIFIGSVLVMLAGATIAIRSEPYFQRKQA